LSKEHRYFCKYNSQGERIWYDKLTGEEIPYNQMSYNSKRAKVLVSSEKICKARWQRERQNAIDKKRRLKSEHIYFKEHADFGEYIIGVHVPEILRNPNPMVPLWATGTNTSVRQGGRVVTDKRWFNLKREYRFIDFYKKKAEGPMYCYTMKKIIDHPPEARTALAASYIEDGIIDLNAKIPLSEVKLTRIPNDQVISSEFDDDYGKYNHQGQKVPSWIWTVFPSMTGIFLIFGLIALLMEGGILFGIGLFILWCVGMYKNAEYKDRINK